jgi:hypothetical protein
MHGRGGGAWRLNAAVAVEVTVGAKTKEFGWIEQMVKKTTDDRHTGHTFNHTVAFKHLKVTKVQRIQNPNCPGRRGRLTPLAFPYVNRFCMALLYGRAGRLTAKTGGFRPGQCGCPTR